VKPTGGSLPRMRQIAPESFTLSIRSLPDIS